MSTGLDIMELDPWSVDLDIHDCRERQVSPGTGQLIYSVFDNMVTTLQYQCIGLNETVKNIYFI